MQERMLDIVAVTAAILLALPFFLWIGYRWGRSAHRKSHEKYRNTSGTITCRQVTHIQNLCQRHGFNCPQDLNQYSMNEARALIIDLQSRPVDDNKSRL